MQQIAELAQSDVDRLPPLESRYQIILDKVHGVGPQFVAVLDRAFPNARWAAMGRDSAVFGDLIEGFFLAQGETDRVARIGLSGKSFDYDSTFTYVYDYMVQLGADPTGAKGERPFIILDTVSDQSSGATQPRKIIAEVYERVLKETGNLNGIVRRFNTLGLVVQNRRADFGTTIEGGDSALTEMQRKYDAAARLHSISSVKHEFLSLGSLTPFGKIKGFNDIGYNSACPFWHDTFGEIGRVGEKIVASPGWAYETEEREQVIRLMFELNKVVSHPDFRTETVNYARSQLGHTMQFGAPSKSSPVVPPVKPVKPKTVIEKIVEAFDEAEKRLGEQKLNSIAATLDSILDDHDAVAAGERNSDLGRELESFFESMVRIKPEILAVEFLDALRYARDAKKLTTTDLKRLLPKVFNPRFMSRTLAKKLYAYYSQAGSFAHVMKDRENFPSGDIAEAYDNLMLIINETASGSCSGIGVLAP